MSFHPRKRKDMLGIKKQSQVDNFFPQQSSEMEGKGLPCIRLLLLVYKLLNFTLCVLHTPTPPF